MPYPARKIPLDPRSFSTHKSLQRVAAFVKNANASIRQDAIDYVVTAQAFSKSETKSLQYDAGLNQPGKNIAGDIRIGPSAFEQDLEWLAGIVFHELVHSPQYAYYVSNGVKQIDPDRSDVERRMIALDEYEAYSWTIMRSVELALSQPQQTAIRHRAGFALIDLDDEKVRKLAQSQQFDPARDELIRQYNSTTTSSSRGALSRNKCSSCYA
jgi:hypothetical protein